MQDFLLFILCVAFVQARTTLFCAERAPTIFEVYDFLTCSKTEPKSNINSMAIVFISYLGCDLFSLYLQFLVCSLPLSQ